MAKSHKPRSGSMQFWPRVRAKKLTPRVRTVRLSNKPLTEFAGYKSGMTHALMTDNRKASPTKGEEISIPVTGIECPKLIIIGFRSYSNSTLLSEEFFNTNKKTLRKSNIKKSKSLSLENCTELRAIVQTNPPFKKTPEIFEAKLSGDINETYKLLKEKKEISITDVFEEGDFVDTHSITKGKGFQGPMKRFGISKRSHKSEKSIRNPGSLGPWVSYHYMGYRVPKAGQTGFHLRTELSKFIMKISNTPEEVNPTGGFLNYGLVKSDFILIKGSIPGPKKRLIRLTPALRKTKEEAPTISEISKKSKQ